MRFFSRKGNKFTFIYFIFLLVFFLRIHNFYELGAIIGANILPIAMQK